MLKKKLLLYPHYCEKEMIFWCGSGPVEFFASLSAQVFVGELKACAPLFSRSNPESP